MFKVTIQIDVKNAAEVMKKEGGAIGGVASMFMTDEQKKAKVEEAVRAEVIKGLQSSLKDELTKKGVSATISIG